MNHFACLNTFVTVVQRGGFGAAARYLGIAPATVTQQIQILEQRIGARLLLRTTRKSALTEAGQVFFERGVKILEDLREADAIASAYHSTVKGTVRLNTSPTLSKDVSALIWRYLELHPETSFDLTVTSKISDLLDDRIDLAIRDEEVPDLSLITRRLATAEWTPCASAAYVARHGMPAHPEELSNHNCLLLPNDQSCNEWQFMSKNGTQTVRVSGTMRSSDPHVLRTAALSDQGIILLPDALVGEDLEAGRLVRVLSAYRAQAKTIRAVVACRRQMPLKVRKLLDFAAKHFRSSTDRARPRWTMEPSQSVMRLN